jgi:predicted DNA binding CopG/RHH family protein
MKRITVYLTEQQMKTIEAMVEATGLKFAELLRRVIDKGLEDYDQKPSVSS